MKGLMALMLTLMWSLSSTAGQAIFCLEMTYHSEQKNIFANVRCTINQFLQETTGNVTLSCEGNDSKKRFVKTSAKSIGIDGLTKQQYSTYALNQRSPFGAVIFSGLGLLDIQGEHVLKIVYGNKRPRATENALTFEDVNGKFYRVEINSLEYGVCQ